MEIAVVGISHQSGSLEDREKAARSIPNKPGTVALVTCNRVELYVSGEDRALAHGWRGSLGEGGYAHFGTAAFHHLAQVTAGLLSALIGENDIQGQVRRAYQEAVTKGPLEGILHYLFQKCLQLGKQLRTQVPLYQITPCYGPAVVELLTRHQPKTILVVGSSQINTRIIEAAQEAGFSNITRCTKEGGFEVIRRWDEFDALICATRCPHVFITRPSHTTGEKLLIDLSVPRNIDPELGKIWTLWGLDDLHARMAEQMPPRAAWNEVEAFLRVRVNSAVKRRINASYVPHASYETSGSEEAV
jgi:glutamyl-tRNA reductase